MVSLLRPLSPKAVSNLNIIRAGVARGLPSTEINALIRHADGSGMRRQELLRTIRYVKGVEDSFVSQRSVRKDRFINPDNMPYSATKILRDYTFTADIRWRDPETGERMSRQISISSSGNMTPNDVEREIDEIIQSTGLAVYGLAEDVEYEVVFLGGVRRNPDL